MLAKLINLAVLGLMPLAWMAPLAENDGGWLFSSEEITVFSGVQQLYEREPALAILVGLFAVVVPYVKSLLLIYVQFNEDNAPRVLLPIIEFLARFSDDRRVPRGHLHFNLHRRWRHHAALGALFLHRAGDRVDFCRLDDGNCASVAPTPVSPRRGDGYFSIMPAHEKR